MDFLFNVAIQSRPYLMFALFVVACSLIKEVGPYKIHIRLVALLLSIIGIAIGVTSPSVTPKNQTDYNKVQELSRLQALDETREAGEAVDKSRQPKTVEERAQTAVDMRERIKAEPYESSHH